MTSIYLTGNLGPDWLEQFSNIHDAREQKEEYRCMQQCCVKLLTIMDSSNLLGKGKDGKAEPYNQLKTRVYDDWRRYRNSAHAFIGHW